MMSDWGDNEVTCELAERLIEIRKEMKHLDDEAQGIRQYMMQQHEDQGVGEAHGPGWRSTVVYPKPRRELSTTLLLKNGVSVDVIENSHIEREVRSYVSIKEVKEDEAE